MKWQSYIKSYGLLLSINLLIFSMVCIVLLFINTPITWYPIVFIIWFGPMLSFMIVHYLRHRDFHSHISVIQDRLDQVYLLPEVITKPNGWEEKQTYLLLKQLGKVMHEEIKYHRDIQRDYREYMELWVHEIKTPIASSKLIVENNPSQVTKRIGRQLTLIEDGIEQVLYYAKSSDVSKDYKIQRFALDSLVKKSIKRNARDMIEKRMHVMLDLPSIEVMCDPKWLGFIFHQVLTNAIKYTDKQPSTLRIQIIKHEQSVACVIQDEGVGIPQQDIHRVFEKGFTGENGRLFAKSTGMGLYLCRTCAERMGIKIHIDSVLNKGTRVTILIPKSDMHSACESSQ